MQNTNVCGSVSTIQDAAGRAPAATIAKTQPIAGLLACSGCAGDYEDPDATAWTENLHDRDESDEDAQPVDAEKFPVPHN